MDVNDNVPCLNDRVVWTFFASKLAPTVFWVHLKEIGWLAGRHRWQASSHRDRVNLQDPGRL
ncbi:hypothetical protein D3C81_334060 [compost metagenome]